jgi:uncharacterized protein YciI
MGLYVLVCNDKPDSLELRLANREAHLAYARGFADRLKVAGPLLDEAGNMAGSLLILEADSLEELIRTSGMPSTATLTMGKPRH